MNVSVPGNTGNQTIPIRNYPTLPHPFVYFHYIHCVSYPEGDLYPQPTSWPAWFAWPRQPSQPSQPRQPSQPARLTVWPSWSAGWLVVSGSALGVGIVACSGCSGWVVECLCGGGLFVWGAYPKQTFRPHVYISGWRSLLVV